MLRMYAQRTIAPHDDRVGEIYNNIIYNNSYRTGGTRMWVKKGIDNNDRTTVNLIGVRFNDISQHAGTYND